MQLLAPIDDRVFVTEPAEHTVQSVSPTLAVCRPTAHGAHFDVDMPLYCPREHAEQAFAPADASEFVIDPARQRLHAIFASVLNMPAEQEVQLVAPVEASASVTEPAAQTVHATVDELLNRPGTHAMQLLAPIDDRVFVTEPAEHNVHKEFPTADLKRPALQPLHKANLKFDAPFEEGRHDTTALPPNPASQLTAPRPPTVEADRLLASTIR
jgi:hypothetical protein